MPFNIVVIARRLPKCASVPTSRGRFGTCVWFSAATMLAVTLAASLWPTGCLAVESDEELVTRLAAVRTRDDGTKVVSSLPADLSPPVLAALRALDRRLSEPRRTARDDLGRLILVRLAVSGDGTSLDYVRQVFDGFPARRAAAAQAVAQCALAGQRRPTDWQVLVRSLPVVEEDDAILVLRALRSYRQLATRAEWQRQVIRVGMQLGAPGSAEAIQLLEHWTGQDLGAPESHETLEAWRAWFARKYPDLPGADLPADPPEAKYHQRPLRDYLTDERVEGASLENGRLVFEKAMCAKCHRVGTFGERLGPDLSTVAARLHRREILESLLFPGAVIPDEYVTHTVVTKGGTQFTGLVHMTPQSWTVLQVNGEKVVLPRQEIDHHQYQPISAMPAGLLETLTLPDIADLFAFLERSPSAVR